MRLLHRSPTGGFELITFDDDSLPPYAILSHTWSEGQEVTYNELVAGVGIDKTGYAKICFCDERAAADGLDYFWIDTCCINKSTSDELSTAINSMFRWYQRASKCYVYLSDVSVQDEISDAEASRETWMEDFRRSRWFTRGWTLQELLAPTSVDFFCKQGKRLGSKESLEQEIHQVTQIPIKALGGLGLSEFSVEDRMSWVARRKTTLKEDKVYCLLGIFGVFLSLIYGEGEAYANLRLREEIKKRHEGVGVDRFRSLSVFPSLPFPRNDLFVGRTYELESLEKYLLSSERHRRMTIYGLGGCGKTALAIEFAYRAIVRHARLVFWVPAVSRESFELAYRDIGVRLCVTGITDENADIKQLVCKALDSSSVDNWLMIVDNTDDLEVLLGATTGESKPARLTEFLPHCDKGSILFTTRSRKVAGALTQCSILGLGDISKDEARQLLAQQTKKQELLDDETAVDELLNTLAYLPLAIVQAAAFINNNDVSVSGYISLFGEAGAETELFSERFKDPRRYEELDSTISKTWHISFDQIRKQDPLAAEYLSFMACVDRINIPQSMLPPSGSVVQQVKALGTLTGYAFITERQQTGLESNGERFFDMHRLVHMASVWWLDGHGERAAWVETTLQRLEELVPYGEHKTKALWKMYLSHAIHAAGIDGVGDGVASASLRNRVGQCQASLGQYSAAAATHQQVLTFSKKKFGPEHVNILSSMGSFALAVARQGKYNEAETLHREVLALHRKVLGYEHPNTLHSMSQLVAVLNDQGNYREAEVMNRETLALQQRVLGPEDPNTMISMSYLATVLDHQGRYREAEAMHKETVALQKRALGSEHLNTLASMNNLALIMENQGKYEEAETILREEVELYRKVVGPEHPHTLSSMANLALVLSEQGKYKEAEKMHKEELALCQKVLGSEHPDTLISMNNLALVLDRQGKHEDAEVLHRKELGICKNVLGQKHPDTLTSMCNLAIVLGNRGKFEEAEAKSRETLALRNEVLGPEHPDSLESLRSLAHILGDQLRYDESIRLYRKACALYDTVLGNDHPAARACREELHRLLRSQKKRRKLLDSGGSEISTDVRTSRISMVLRGFAKIGIGRSKNHNG